MAWENGCKLEKDFFLTLFVQWLLSNNIGSGAIKIEFVDLVWGLGVNSN